MLGTSKSWTILIDRYQSGRYVSLAGESPVEYQAAISVAGRAEAALPAGILSAGGRVPRFQGGDRNYDVLVEMEALLFCGRKSTARKIRPKAVFEEEGIPF